MGLSFNAERLLYSGVKDFNKTNRKNASYHTGGRVAGHLGHPSACEALAHAGGEKVSIRVACGLALVM